MINIPVDEVVEALNRLRDEVDTQWEMSYIGVSYNDENAKVSSFLPNRISQYKARQKIPYPYPKGHCAPITGIIIKILGTEEVYEQLPRLRPIQDYFKTGDARLIWGACRGRYFQTAMQIGEWYVDVANDTVDTTKPKVEIHRMDDPECPFAFIRDLQTYLEIKESYHNVKLYRNTVFPDLMHLYPFISCSKTDGILRVDENLLKIKLQQTDPNYTSTLNNYPELPDETIHWIRQQPELMPFTVPNPHRHGNPTSKSHLMQLRLEVTAINVFLENQTHRG